MSKQLVAPVTAGAIPRVSGRVLEDAIAGKRTPITKHGRVVAAVVGVSDLEQLERLSLMKAGK